MNFKKHFSIPPRLFIFLLFPLVGITAAVAVIAGSSNQNVLPGLTSDIRNVPHRGWLAPNFELTTLDGSSVQLIDFRGRIVFLNFWATWCIPCQRELPAFQAFVESQDPELGPTVLAVNLGETREQIETYFAQNGIKGIPTILDPTGIGRKLYGVMSVPVTYVIDAEGVLQFMKLGETTTQDISDYMIALRNKG